MARSLDGLIRHLLDQIALCGEHGALPSDYITYVRSYYDSPEKTVVATEHDTTAQKPGTITNVDRAFLEQVWKWLIGHPEVNVRGQAGQKRLTLSDVEAHNDAVEQAKGSHLGSRPLEHESNNVSLLDFKSVADNHDGLASQHPKNGSAHLAARIETDIETAQGSETVYPADHQSVRIIQNDETVALIGTSDKPTEVTEVSARNHKIRLHASENRMWHALTGHGPDSNKVRLLDFACLSLIAASGPKGIYQNDLVKGIGQDKRSVPGRTERLFDDGYILKERVTIQLFNPKRIMHTSHLVLKRFAKDFRNPNKSPETTTSTAPVKRKTKENTDLNESQESGLNGQASQVHGKVRELERPVPQWIPDRSLSNQIFELVQRSGAQGMSMNDIRDNMFGESFRRPITEYVTRLCECWQMSQPLHLRHLSIIRDTVLKGKGSIFNHYTYESFNKLVEKGIGFWEAVVSVPDDLTAGKNFAASIDAVPELDNFGFPVIDSNFLCGSSNNATIEECTSVLRPHIFPISSNAPTLKRQGKGIQFPRSKAAPKEPKILARDMAFPPVKPPKPVRPTKLSASIKPRGRPRKYPTTSATSKNDSMDIHTVGKSHHSLGCAEKYARSKIEKEKSSRVAEGGDAALVASCVLDEVESLQEETGQDPLSSYTKGMILHTFAGGLEPPPLVHLGTTRQQPKRAPYLPSMAAHTILVPNTRRRKARISKDRLYRPSMAAHTILVPDPKKALKRGSKTPLESGKEKGHLRRARQPPENSLKSKTKGDTPRAKKQRRSRANTQATAVVPCSPSAAAHFWPHHPPGSLSQGLPQEKEKRGRGRPRKEIAPQVRRQKSLDLQFQYLPSISAHSGSFLPSFSRPTAKAPNGNGVSKVSKNEGSVSLHLSPPDEIQLRYLPSIASPMPSSHLTRLPPPNNTRRAEKSQRMTLQHGQAYAITEIPNAAAQSLATSPEQEVSHASLVLHSGPYPEGFYPGWVKYMSKYYETSLKDIVRDRDGVYLGRTAHRRKRASEPTGFRPHSYKVVVFRLARLRELPWFNERRETPQHAPSSLAKGQSPLHSPAPASPLSCPRQSDAFTAGEPSFQPPVSVSLHDNSWLSPTSQPFSQPCRASLRYAQETSVRSPVRDVLLGVREPFNRPNVFAPQYSRLPPLEQSDRNPSTDYTSPYSNTTGIKRKREEFHQPDRGPPPSDPFSMNANSERGSAVQRLESGAPDLVQAESGSAVEDIDPSNVQDPKPVVTEASYLDMGKATSAVGDVPSATNRVYSAINNVTFPTEQNLANASNNRSVIHTIESTSLSNAGETAPPVPDNTQSVNEDIISVAENLLAIADQTPVMTHEPEKQTSVHNVGTNNMLDQAENTVISSVRISTSPVSGKDEAIDKNNVLPVQTPGSYEASSDDFRPTLHHSCGPTNASVNPNLSLEGKENRNDHSGSPTKSPGPQETIMTSITPSTDGALLQSHVVTAIHNQRQPESSGTKSKPLRTRKFFEEASRQGGSVAMLRRRVVMEIIDKCGGVYAGHRELIKPFILEWERKGLQGGTPEERTMQNTVDALCNEGKLQQIKFFFKDQKGLKVMKDMLMYPDVDVLDSRVKDVQRRVIAHYPRYYWPSAAVPPDEYSDKIQKMMDGKERVQDAKYAALRKEEVARLENSSRNEVEEGASAAHSGTDFDQLPRVPLVPRMTPSHAKRLDSSRLGGRRSRVRKPTSFTTATIQPPLPRLADLATNDCQSLLWLPEQYSFSEFNFEEERPTMLEPTIREDDHRPHTRYGMQIDPPSATRRLAHKELASHRKVSSSLMQRPSPWGALPSKKSYVRLTAHQLDDSSYHSPYGPTTFVFPSSALPTPNSYARSQTSHGSPAEPFQPRRKRLIVNFMDAIHYFHQSSGTFSVGFSGLARPRPINKDVGTCLKPYSYGVRSIHPEFTIPRGPRNVLPTRSLEDEDTLFEKEVDSLLRLELESGASEYASFGHSTFINHVFSHAHTTVEAVNADMDLIKGVIVPSDGGRIKNRRLTDVDMIGAHMSDSILHPGSRNMRRAATEASEAIEMRAKLKRRRLTTLLEDTPQGTSPDNVEMDADGRVVKFRRIRGPRPTKLMRRDDERRLVVAVLIVRTLTGGVEELVDWVLVAEAFDPTYELDLIRKRWRYIRNRFRLALPKMEADFQDIFAKAYEEGSVPPLDFDHLQQYDWKWLTDWTLEHLGRSNQSQPDLPIRRAEFNDLYALTNASKTDINDYYEINGLVNHTAAKRESILTSSAYVSRMGNEVTRNSSQADDQIAIARTWIRANSITPPSTYNPERASAKLGTLPDPVLNEALEHLLSSHILSRENKGRLIPGRGYYISDHFISRLRKNILPANIQRAVAFKQYLDEDFAEGKTVLFPYAPGDGDTLAVMNLSAHKRIKLVPINLPLNEWGQADGGYESRRMDKSRLNFQVALQPLPSYVPGNPLEPIPAPPAQHLQGPMARIPLWYDIYGELVPAMWGVALAAVMAVLAVRAGVGAEEIEKATRPAMEAWEIQLVLGWLVEAKAATRVGSGFILDEWWWFALPPNGETEIDPLTVCGDAIDIDGSSNEQTLDLGKEREGGGSLGPETQGEPVR